MKRMTIFVLASVASMVLYGLGLLATIFLSPKQDLHSYVLSFAATELVLLERGRVLSKEQWFPSYECLLVACPETAKELRTPYIVALDHARAKFISPGPGKATCSVWIFESLWRDGCIHLSIYTHELNQKELTILFDFLKAPCRYTSAPITTSLKLFDCQGDKANKPRPGTLFVWRSPRSPNYPFPEKISILVQ